MSNILRNLTIDFGSLVDEPANKGARIMLFKRDADATPVVDADALVGKVGRKMSTSRMAALKVAVENLNRILSEVADPEADDDGEPKEQGMKKQDTAPVTEPATEQTPEAPVVEVAAVSEDITKRLADLEKRAADAERRAVDAEGVAKRERDERLNREWISKAERTFNALPVSADVLGPILKRASETLSVEDCAEIDRVLTAANEAVSKSALFGEVGKADAGASESATDRLNQMAHDMVVSKAASNYADAITAVSNNPANAPLIAAYQAERRTRN